MKNFATSAALLILFVMTMAVCVPFVSAQASGLESVDVLGNELTGYLPGGSSWFEFRSLNLSDEDLKELEKMGYAQYCDMDNGLIVTMFSVGGDQVSGETDEDKMIQMLNVNLSGVYGLYTQPDYSQFTMELGDGTYAEGVAIVDRAEEKSAPNMFYIAFKNTRGRIVSIGMEGGMEEMQGMQNALDLAARYKTSRSSL